MKALFAFCVMVAATLVWANPASSPQETAAVRGGNLGAGASATLLAMSTAHPMRIKMTVTGDIRVPKANGTNALTVAEIITKSAELKDQTVMVRGKVVKYNPDIMGKNWVHLRDGTGSTVDETNDLVVTTEDEAKIGDVVTAKGVVRTDLDFGSGYTYKVLIEEATLQ